MPKLWISVLGFLQEIGDRSGCHQLPERSFRIKTYTFPVCARCTGVFFGQISAVIAFLFGVSVHPAYSAVMLAVMGMDWLVQQAGWKQSTNIRRLITGIGGGFGLFSVYLYCFVQILKVLI